MTHYSEVGAALPASRKVEDIGFPSLILEGDSLKVIQAIIQGIPEAQSWSINNVIFDVRSILSKLPFWSASHVFRLFKFCCPFYS